MEKQKKSKAYQMDFPFERGPLLRWHITVWESQKALLDELVGKMRVYRAREDERMTVHHLIRAVFDLLVDKKDKINLLNVSDEGDLLCRLKDALSPEPETSSKLHWISVADVLPTALEPVLLWDKDVSPRPFLGVYKDNLEASGFFMAGHGGLVRMVATHWLPLPESSRMVVK